VPCANEPPSRGHWIAESRNGATLQIYLALIASLLLQLYTGGRPTKRMMQLIRFHLIGWASPSELEAGLERCRQELARRKKILNLLTEAFCLNPPEGGALSV
jgi:hypothetical protein